MFLSMFVLLLLQGCYNITEIGKQFLTHKHYNVLLTAKTLVLLLVQGCYNIKEIAVQFLAEKDCEILITVKC